MSRRSFLLELKEAGDLALWHDYRSGDTLDRSGNGNDGVASSTVAFGRSGAEFTDGSAMITVADALSLQSTTLTLVVFGAFAQQALNQYLLQKRDAGGNSYAFGISPGGGVVFFNAPVGGTRITAQAVEGYNYLSVSTSPGGVPRFYRDGLSIADFSGTATVVADDAPLIIGNDFTGGNQTEDPIGAVAIINRILTDTEHAKLYGELANQDWGQRVL